MKPIFISGIGTGIGKTLVAAVFTEALHADYWKPVQAGSDPETDSQRLASLISHAGSCIHPRNLQAATGGIPPYFGRKGKPQNRSLPHHR